MTADGSNIVGRTEVFDNGDAGQIYVGVVLRQERRATDVTRRLSADLGVEVALEVRETRYTCVPEVTGMGFSLEHLQRLAEGMREEAEVVLRADVWFLDQPAHGFLPLATSATRSVPAAMWSSTSPWEQDALLARVVAQAEQRAQAYYDQWERSQRPDESGEI